MVDPPRDTNGAVNERDDTSVSGPSRAVWQRVLPVAIVLVVCIAAVGWHVSEYTHIGPLDEQAHLDYVNRLVHGRFPAFGEKLTRETREQVACRGLETPIGFGDHPDCARVLTNKGMPENGNAYEAGQPPIYYGTTALVSRVLPGDDVDSLRLVGGLWLGVGAVGLYLALRRLKVATAFAVVATLVLALSPPLLFSASVVTNDIAIWTFGGLALWVVVWLMQVPELRWVHLLVGAAVGVVGALVKPTALLVIAALALAVLLQQWWAGRAKWGWLLAGSMVLAAGAATGAWGLVVTGIQHQSMREVEPWARYHVDSLRFADLFRQPLFNFLSPYKAFIPKLWRFDWIMDWMFQAALYVGVGLLLLPVLAREPDDRSRSIGIAYLVAVLISGPYYVTLYFVSTHIVFGADARFSYGLLPMLGVLLGVWVARAWQRWTIAAVLAVPILWYVLLVTGAVAPSAK